MAEVSPFEQTIINMTWAASRAFKLKSLTKVHVSGTIYLNGGQTRDFGHCTPEGLIQIRHKYLGKRAMENLPVDTIIDSIAHELAHLYRYEHGREHKTLQRAIIVWLEFNWE